MGKKGLINEEEAWTVTDNGTDAETDVVQIREPVWAFQIEIEIVQGSIAAFCTGQEFMWDDYKHFCLQNDVIDHLWPLHGTA